MRNYARSAMCAGSWSGAGSKLVLALILATAFGSAKAAMHGARFLPDAVAQFNALNAVPDPLGFHIDGSPDPSSCKHYQGLERYAGADGTVYFFVTRSGNVPTGVPSILCREDSVVVTDDPGNLLVVRMASRDTQGERLRSNRLARGRDTDRSAPPAGDTVVRTITFDGSQDGNGQFWPAYGHPGGMQLVGDTLAVAMEASYAPEDGWAERLVLFLDVSDPTLPRITSTFELEDGEHPGVLTGNVGIAPLRNGRYLMVLTGGTSNEELGFFESVATEPDGTTDLASPDLDWEFVDNVFPGLADAGFYSDEVDYPGPGFGTGTLDPTGAHQTLQFLRETSMDGTLYLAGARGKIAVPGAEDWLELMRVEIDEDRTGPRFVTLRHVSSQRRLVKPPDNVALGDNLANFAAASTFYVSPNGELIFYATEHDNDGPDGTVKMGEWRHLEMERRDSSTRLPYVDLRAEHQVQEGGAVVIPGIGRPPKAKPWVQLFAEANFGLWFINLAVDLEDIGRDDFDNFNAFQVQLPVGGSLTVLRFNDAVSSVRWFAPSPCQVLLGADAGVDLDSPADQVLTVDGTGTVAGIPNLGGVTDDAGSADMNDRITSVAFVPACAEYYASTFAPDWDLDGDGVFETTGGSPVFGAEHLDGPDRVVVQARAVHPLDGATGYSTTAVRVFNAAPAIQDLGAFDSGQRRIGLDIPFAITGQPVLITATFTDPGRLDTQTATIDWGDGSTDEHGSFDSFSDAYGGAVGALRHLHSYPVPATYGVTATVTDDDLGSASATTSVEVVSPAQAIGAVLDGIEAALALPVSNVQFNALRVAARALSGGSDRAQDGALDMLADENSAAALAKLRLSLRQLLHAQELGADVGMSVAILEALITALASAQ